MERIARGGSSGGLNVRKWVIAAIGLALIVTGATLWFWWMSAPSVRDVLSRLPQTDRLIAHIDLATLRTAGVLYVITGNRNTEEPDYKRFVDQTGFDYRRDLDTASISWQRDESFFLLTGRFDWGKLQQYARSQGGSCSGGLCRMSSSTPGRRISFTRLNGVTLAVASSVDDAAARRLTSSARQAFPLDIPGHPVWMMLPASLLRDESLLPSGSRMFATAVSDAQSVVLAIGGQQKDGEIKYEAMLDARFRTSETAAETAQALKAATNLLNRMLAREKQQPNPRDLSGVLSRGQFKAEDNRVIGVWPIEKVFLENLGI